MKKILFTTLSIFTTGLVTTAWEYNGPWDERMPPGRSDYMETIGFYAQNLTMAAVADVIADVPHVDNILIPTTVRSKTPIKSTVFHHPPHRKCNRHLKTPVKWAFSKKV